ncbi:phosphate/phosphite/phosphonate ABC transporter substrate-binding protein [Desulfoluna limicola]|uniref:phosphate/phosphite/phosphonate ABC transporter substrate-binding protein n=1 Tax=Desulfoluna limicola TaxID=2810562 RepID=UPI001F1F9753|nr:PhnD/SsuA/transferrin family substrate-binding protein [Desulfoluna limicola]
MNQIRHGNTKHLACTLCFFLSVLFASALPGSAGKAEAFESRNVGVGYIANTISGVDKRDAKVALEIMVRKIVMRQFPDVESSSVIYEDLETAVKALENEEIDIMTLLSTNYLELRDRSIMTPKFIGSIGGEPEEEYVLLVKGKNNITTLHQLRNKKLIIQNGGSGSISTMWLDTLLMEQALPESHLFFNSVKKVDKISMAVLPVFFGQVDACIVPKYAYETMVELNPQVGRDLNVLSESPGYLITVTCYRSGIDEKDQMTISSQFDTLDETPEYRQILILFHLKSVKRYKPEYLLNVEKLYTDYHRLKLASNLGKQEAHAPE